MAMKPTVASLRVWLDTQSYFYPTFNNTVEITPIMHQLRVVSLNPIFSRMLWLESESVIDREFHWIPSANEKQGNLGQRSRQFDSWSFHGHLTAWHGRKNLHVWTELGIILQQNATIELRFFEIPLQDLKLVEFQMLTLRSWNPGWARGRCHSWKQGWCWIYPPQGCQSPQGWHDLFSRKSLQTFICHCYRVRGKSNLYVCFVSMSFRVAVTIFNVNDWSSLIWI